MIPLRGLACDDIPSELAEKDVPRYASRGITQVQVIASLWEQNPCLHEPLRRYLSRRASWIGKYAVEMLGLEPGVPFSLGGWPLSDLKPKRKVSDETIRLWASGTRFTFGVKR